jgi:asparagine synthase (glutamine-hydrolysing)
MSGIIVRLSDAGKPDAQELTAKLAFVDSTRSHTGRAGPFEFGLTWIGPDSFHPLRRHAGAPVTAAMLGRLYAPETGRRLDLEFDRVLEGYLRGGARALCPLDGAGGLVVFDERTEACFVVTDPMGFYPLYAAFPDAPGRTALSSHPDVLAAALPEPLALDEVTMAEFLATGRSVHPYTYYRDVRQLDAGSLYRWDPGGLRRVLTYWRLEPRLDPAAGLEDLAEELAASIRRSVRVRLANVEGRAGLLLSGGLDSRAVMFSADDAAEQLLGITFYNRVNREVRYSRRLTGLAGVPHLMLKRGFDYYGRAATEAVRISGGMWDLMHAHTAGFSERIADTGLGLLLSGCYMDYLFKGFSLNVWRRQAAWMLPPVEHLAEFSPQWYVPHHRLESPQFAEAVAGRLEQMYEGLDLEDASPQNLMRIEHRRLWPISRTAEIAFRTVMSRTLPYDVVNADSAVVEMLRRAPPSFKLNRRLFLAALHRMAPESLEVPDANYGFWPGTGWLGEVTRGLLHRWNSMVERRMLRRGIVGNGSWISWPAYIPRSALVARLWGEVKDDSAEMLEHLLGYDPFALDLEQWAQRASLFTRLLTLGLWHKYRIRHR